MAPDFIRYRGVDTLSFRQLDALNGVPKGTTFRRFKYCAELVEGRDFFHVAAEAEPGRIAEWRDAGLIYPGSVHVVLITESGYRRLQAGGGEGVTDRDPDR